jgi:hypothetical protein
VWLLLLLLLLVVVVVVCTYARPYILTVANIPVEYFANSPLIVSNPI